MEFHDSQGKEWRVPSEVDWISVCERKVRITESPAHTDYSLLQEEGEWMDTGWPRSSLRLEVLYHFGYYHLLFSLDEFHGDMLCHGPRIERFLFPPLPEACNHCCQLTLDLSQTLACLNINQV